jgi:8-oxo-dGTP pyrophosphatase MutT (NUDIX family)
MIFAEGPSGLDVCFIRRTEREDDPWSGHVSFPGGRAEADDTCASAVAERETFEEIGMALQQSQRIGVLPVLPKIRRGLTLFPFVYFVDEATRSTAMVNAPEEVASVFWVPFSHLLDPQAVTQLEYSLDELPATFPGVQFGDHVIWGLTLHLVNSFAELVNKPLPTFD